MKLLTIAFVVAAVAPLQAQSVVRAPEGWSISAFGGGAAFTAFQHGSVQGLAASPTDGLQEQEFPQRIGAKSSGAFAAAISYWPKQSWGLRLFGSYSPSQFQTIMPQGDAQQMVALVDSDAESLASLAISSLEIQTLIRLPTLGQKLMPYGIGGIGAVKYAAQDGALPEDAERDFASGSQVRPAVRLGLGAMLQMRSERLGLNFELTDQIARTPVRGDGGRDVSFTNAVSFMVGLTWTAFR